MKKENVYLCQVCSFQTSKWLGKCPECNTWNSLDEKSKAEFFVKKTTTEVKKSKSIDEIAYEDIRFFKTGFEELDRVLGGGLCKSSVLLLSGEPGVGKSTLLLSLIKNISLSTEQKILYVSGEETEGQIAKRAGRIGCRSRNIHVLSETRIEKIKNEIEILKPDLLIIDSIQTTKYESSNVSLGSSNQLREICCEIVQLSKSNHITTLVVGQLTKDGSVAGPKTIEHLVDVVLSFENSSDSKIKILRSTKNRFGSTLEIGMFELSEVGLKDCVESEMFKELEERNVVGRSLGVEIIGSKLMVHEIQALVVDNKSGPIKRTAYGIDNNRFSILIAIIEKYLGLNLNYKDIYLSMSGKTKSATRETDLAIIAAIFSAIKNQNQTEKTIYYGEVGLGGDIKSTLHESDFKKYFRRIKVDKIVTTTLNSQETREDLKSKLVGLVSIQNLIEI